jgi:predicted esterase
MPPHAGQPVAAVGPPLGAGRGLVIMAHGRNAGPANILDLAPRLARPEFTYLAPEAAGRTWYPFSFMAQIERNEPGLSSGLAVLAGLVEKAAGAGLPSDRVVLLGFSQGACLAAEFAIRHPARYGGVVVFSGGLIGPPETVWETGAALHQDPALQGTPVFLGCSDQDSHVPASRVEQSARVFRERGADVTMRIYPGMGHLVNDDEIAWAQALLDRVGA